MTTNTIHPQVNGPLLVEGNVELVEAGGASVIRHDNKIWLCRCGHSENKPFCDGAHNKIGFRDDATVPAGYVIKKPQAGVPAGALRLTPKPDGPVHCLGAVNIVGADGSKWSGDQANLCRCGHSANKPFCDGSHREAGFRTD